MRKKASSLCGVPVTRGQISSALHGARSHFGSRALERCGALLCVFDESETETPLLGAASRSSTVQLRRRAHLLLRCGHRDIEAAEQSENTQKLVATTLVAELQRSTADFGARAETLP